MCWSNSSISGVHGRHIANSHNDHLQLQFLLFLHKMCISSDDSSDMFRYQCYIRLSFHIPTLRMSSLHMQKSGNWAATQEWRLVGIDWNWKVIHSLPLTRIFFLSGDLYRASPNPCGDHFQFFWSVQFWERRNKKWQADRNKVCTPRLWKGRAWRGSTDVAPEEMLSSFIAVLRFLHWKLKWMSQTRVIFIVYIS